VDKPTITYTGRADATKVGHRDVLSAIYRLVLDSQANEEAAAESRPNPERICGEIRARGSIR
jgi:hypothetical protein